jgi:hypothetical protein
MGWERRNMSNEEYHASNCAYCGKGIFWSYLLHRATINANGWGSHKSCAKEYLSNSQESTENQK